MKLDANKLTASVRLALTVGASATAGLVGTAAYAQNADSTKGQNLETIVVTGSNIRRVDMETANPILTIGQTQIQQSGKLTVGDLVQQLPSIAGAAVNPNVNNGGGDGRSTISLRGLGSGRSLLLINGHRVSTPLQDLNMMPASAVERIEVLADGASAVYGSDAVAGVVNIITRTNYQGLEFGLDYGISDRDDGARKGFHAMFGHATDKGSIIAGINYNKNDPVMAFNRAYSKDALYKYSYGVVKGGSSRTPNGSISLPDNLVGTNDWFLKDTSGNYILDSHGQKQSCDRVTRIGGTSGNSFGNFRCYQGTNPDGSLRDAYNYQAVGNYDLTRAERTGVFLLGNYKISDKVEAYIEVFHNKTTSNQQVAPLPLDALSDTFISSQSYYNPFGTNFGTDKNGIAYNQFRTRLETLGDRIQDFATTHDLATVGFKGAFGDTSWNWNVDYSFGHLSQNSQQKGYLNYALLANSLGPSFQDPSTGKILCGTPGNVIGGCTPMNIFNINDPNTIAGLQAAKSDPYLHTLYQTRTAEAGVNGDLWELPAGTMQMAAGASYRKEYLHSTVDSTVVGTVNSQGALSCQLAGSICSNNSQGGYNVKEAYVELLVPILKDMPFVHSLKLDIGDRYSKYNLFGSTNNWKIALEYKPIEDLLVRATVSKVFRAPSVTDLYQGAKGDSPTAADPCGSSGNLACGGYTFTNTGTGQVNGVVVGNSFAHQNFGLPAVQPEFGKSYDYGFVYDPQWLPGLSVNADFYRITLNNVIISAQAGTAQSILTDYCFASGAPNGVQITNPSQLSPICNLIKRYNTGGNVGQIASVYESAFNAGNLTTKGIDIGARYRLPETPFGNFRVGFQATYITEYDIQTGFGSTKHLAGKFDRAYGNFARWRGLGSLDWNMGSFSASWTARYIGGVSIGYANSNLGASANADSNPSVYDGSPYHYGSYIYHNLAFGYNIEPLNTMVQVGIDNVADKQPPLFYQQNVINANTDVNTYDTIGRYFWGKVTVKF